MSKGKVKWYNSEKGYGFIETQDGEDVFVHRSGLMNPGRGLDPDQEVVFETKQGDKGLSAINVE